LRIRPLALPTNIRLGLFGENTPAYYKHSQVTPTKKFSKVGPRNEQQRTTQK
jgi:hypothetical protein